MKTMIDTPAHVFAIQDDPIVAVRTRVFEWTGPTAPIPERISISATDIVTSNEDRMRGYAFHAWLVVEIETRSGAVGLGNAAVAPHVTKEIVDRYLTPIVLGASPFDVELLWQRMYRQTMAFGRKGAAMIAISAVDIALWDLMGKLTGLPVHRLLGGRVKPELTAYASKLYNQPADRLRAEAQTYVEQGFTAVKMRLGYGPADGAEGMRRNIENIALVRDTIGEDVDLMLEAYMGWTLEYARQMLPRLEEFRLRWVEEPLIADDVEGFAELRRDSRIPIATGEHEHTIYGFRRLLEARAIDYIQFDTNRVGGISQARKIIAMAEAFSVPVVPHAGQMHNFHLSLSSVICPIVEYFPPNPVEIGNELFWYLFKGEPLAENGKIRIGNEPGLGLSLSDEHRENFRVIE
ncbi:L-alanine-DL-glutamate epimerase-like enolase superfamily enzyme [Aliiruegeria haliotis]|uniref:L-rhamnonate dehydratase n=1 Tax=Aliiruegeria haliotis TaxID=1280846 RepID=A0A2T0RLV2_9RHOB|nr:L-rhamnonate dehydratase [Aliiruegeria haliotis]PRY22111.1 L-alanine-DL-glutamate epimerase-like enolase superfamily enzyme [Aliiruegeria haliotis]